MRFETKLEGMLKDEDKRHNLKKFYHPNKDDLEISHLIFSKKEALTQNFVKMLLRKNMMKKNVKKEFDKFLLIFAPKV